MCLDELKNESVRRLLHHPFLAIVHCALFLVRGMKRLVEER